MENRPESATRRQFEEGRELFNQRRFFEAHEAWERAWLVEQGPARRLLQGLIQIAAGFHKAGSGVAGGCVRLLEAGLDKLSAEAPDPALDAFSGAVRASLAEARRWERGEVSGITEFPGLLPLAGVR
ncbi:MAG TPA: DUF309 domain-containing protein [Thermoanaerobaculia bacterium]|nr:DUF309 domain-containing protein [Thermoanaerobaculia bacterium]